MRSRIVPAVLPLLLVAPALYGQAARGIFVTPIAGVPFSGTVHVERTVIQPNGTVLQLFGSHTIARDSEGRIRNEFQPLAPASVTVPPPVMVVHLYDPQNRMNEYLYPQAKTYRINLVSRPPEADTTDNYASPSAASHPLSQYAQQLDLGQKTMAGLAVHGVRITQTLPPSASGTNAEVVVTDEYWYSDDLRMNLAVRHVDPRTGSFAATVTAVKRAEPDADLFSVPGDYRMAGTR